MTNIRCLNLTATTHALARGSDSAATASMSKAFNDSNWPYQITIYYDDWVLVQSWCEDNIGEFDQDWYKLGIDPADYFRDGPVRTTWLFKEQKNAVAFTLRWK